MTPQTISYCFSPIEASLNISCEDVCAFDDENHLQLEILKIIKTHILKNTFTKSNKTNDNLTANELNANADGQLESLETNAQADSLNYILSNILNNNYFKIDFKFKTKSIVSVENQKKLWSTIGEDINYQALLTKDDYKKLNNINIHDVEYELQNKVFQDLTSISKIGNKTNACCNAIFGIFDDVLLCQDVHFARYAQHKSSSFFDFDVLRAHHTAWNPKQFSRAMENWCSSTNDNFINFSGSITNSLPHFSEKNTKIKSKDVGLFKSLKLLNHLMQQLPYWCENELSVTVLFQPTENSLSANPDENIITATTNIQLPVFLNEINDVIFKKSKTELKNVFNFLQTFLINKNKQCVVYSENKNSNVDIKSLPNKELGLKSKPKKKPVNYLNLDLQNGLVFSFSKNENHATNVKYLWINSALANNFCKHTDINWRHFSKLLPGLNCFWQFNRELYNNGFSLYSNNLQDEKKQSIAFPKISYKIYSKDVAKFDLPQWLITLVNKTDGPFDLQKAKQFFLEQQSFIQKLSLNDNEQLKSKNNNSLIKNFPENQSRHSLPPLEAHISFEQFNYNKEYLAEQNALNSLYEHITISEFLSDTTKDIPPIIETLSTEVPLTETNIQQKQIQEPIVKEKKLRL